MHSFLVRIARSPGSFITNEWYRGSLHCLSFAEGFNKSKKYDT